MHASYSFVASFFVVVFAVSPVYAQQKLGYVDSEYILGQLPEYATVQQQIDRTAQEWQQEIEEQRDEVDELFREYQARELLYTNDERQRQRDEIIQAEEEIERLRMQYFGPEGRLFQEQERLVRPVQESVLEAIEAVATRDGYDYVFDKGGDYIFMYTRDQFDLSDDVLEELGIDTDSQN
jgi:outer membrane protein